MHLNYFIDWCNGVSGNMTKHRPVPVMTTLLEIHIQMSEWCVVLKLGWCKSVCKNMKFWISFGVPIESVPIHENTILSKFQSIWTKIRGCYQVLKFLCNLPQHTTWTDYTSEQQNKLSKQHLEQSFPFRHSECLINNNIW
jgi:hypothetical protein